MISQITGRMPLDDRQINTAAVIAAEAIARELLRPPPNLKPSEWAEQNVRIPEGNAIPGLIRFDNAPYQREPLDMTINPECERITLMWGAQLGKTLLATAAQLYRIGLRPQSQMMMQPSQGDLTTWLETKFNPMVDANPALSERIAKPRGRDGVNNQKMKSYLGYFLMFAWAGSPKTMRGRSAPFIVCDEVDGYTRTKEGNPVGLLWQRAATFGDDRLLLEISTPTFKGASFIEDAFEAGDQRRFYVVCPHCGHHQTLVWSNVKWSKTEDGEHLPETARYLCAGPDCGTLWSDGERVAAVRNAVHLGAGWKASKPFRGHASYHLSELYSSLTSLRAIVRSFLDKRATDDLQTFFNVSLAETWEEKGESVDVAALIGRTEDFSAQVPGGGVVLTVGIDGQDDRLEAETVAWGLGEESWSVDYTVLWGDPLRPEVWAELDDYLAQTWLHRSGAVLPISAACLDTGGRGGYTQAAYEYARGKTGRRLFAVKGAGGWGRPIVSAPSRRGSGRRARKVDLFSVGVDEAKLIVNRRFALTDPGPGYCHVPKTRDPEWFQQVAAETLKIRYVKGFPYREWHKMRPRNEALDCRVYSYAALKIINPNIAQIAKRIACDDDDDTPAPIRPVKPPEDSAPPTAQTGAVKGPRTRRGNRRGTSWAKGW